jgi:hypothetical protein
MTKLLSRRGVTKEDGEWVDGCATVGGGVAWV